MRSIGHASSLRQRICRSQVRRFFATTTVTSRQIHPALAQFHNGVTGSRQNACFAPRLSSQGCKPAAASSSTVSSAGTKSIALVWFKHDMRIDDHPGLHHALAVGEHVVPFFCFDPVRYRQALESPSAASSLAKAVESLRTALRTLGSDLVVTVGAWEEQLPSAVRRFNAAVVVAEEEVEEVWGHGMAAANAALPDDVEVYTWNAPLFDRGTSNENTNSNNTTSLDTFADWRRLHDGAAAVVTPLDPPAFLPSLPADIPLEDAGTLPPAEDLYKMGQTVLAKSAMGSIGSPLMRRKTSGASTSWHTAQPSSSGFDSDGDTTGMTSTQQPSAALGMRSGAAASKTAAEDAADLEIERLPADEPPSYNAATAEEHADGTAWDAELSAELAAGEGPVMQALQSYLSYVETTGESGGSRWQWKLGAAIAKYDVPAAPDGCFPALFSRALGLGVVSKRRIYAEAQVMLHAEPEWAPPAGILQRLGWLLFSNGGATARLKRTRKAAAASAAIEASEFHASMARRREGKEMHGGATLRHWRWRGILTDYLEGTPKEPLPGAPALVLVHGFGAFSEHWRSNVAGLAAQGYHVYAPTLPGYGRSEKPAVRYGQDLWRDYIADFAYQMVGRPVVLVGNSIGGFISASVAADYPDIVAGLVLVNSAGPLQADYVLPSSTPPLPSPPLFVVEAVSRALFAFLQGNVEKQLKRVYPVVPDRADAWLGGEISRASSDPGALGVFRSVFYLPKPRALNYLVTKAFGGPTLVLQGVKDPLNDAKGRAGEIGRLCSNTEVHLLDAGHCPHDEVPEAFNEALAAWVQRAIVVGKRNGQENDGVVDQGRQVTTNI